MTAPLKYQEIPLQEKFIILEELWQSMSQDAENSNFTPNWHLEILAKRDKQINDSKASFSDLEEAKTRLQKLI